MKQLIPALFAVGAVMLLAGAAVYITGWPLSPYIYTIGATMVALGPKLILRPNVKSPHCQTPAPTANIRCAFAGAYGGIHALYKGQ